MTQAQGEVFDIGYQRYHGEREGRVRAIKTLWTNGVRTSLGIGRGLFAKIIPGLAFLVLMIPALLFPVLSAMFGGSDGFGDIIPGQDEFYSPPIVLVFILFTAIVGPELLVSDRRSGVINLYLVRPLTTSDYVLGRWLAFFSVALVMLLVPQATLSAGLILGAGDQVEYIRDNWTDVPRFVAAGAALAMFATTLPLCVSAFVGRRAYAAVFVIAVVLVANVIAGIATAQASEDLAKWFALVSISDYPVFINDMVFAKESVQSPSSASEYAALLPSYAVWGAFALSVVLPAALLWERYRRLAL